MLFNKKKPARGASYNASSGDFIPVACHYDKNTLLTKNGELLQVFQINGINSEKISKKLFNLREIVRETIKNNVDGGNLAFWIHTIRRKANLDDSAPYHNLLSANIHEIWQKKNYWHDKFVNCLYITVIHGAPELKLKNFNSLVNSLSPSIVTEFEKSYLASASSKLTETVDRLLEDLQEFGAQKLGVRIEGEECFSDPMFLYRRIMQLNEKQCHLPIADISAALSSYQYAVGNDMIEVTGRNGKKFAALMSIKEYQEVSSEALDKFLQIPVEMVATEVFYFVDREAVVPSFAEQGHIMDISGDVEIKSLSGLNEILGEVEAGNRFCQQQISFMVIGDNADQLNRQIIHASETLAKIGIVHVREDINLEKTFWAQLPGNFPFLSRMSPTILGNTAALASLHNFPTGNQYNPWGRAVTLLRTEKGTPYFMNFHDPEGNSSCCIFGAAKSGRTTLLNFLLSEADKYKPSIMHIVDDPDSSIFVKGKGGKWLDGSRSLINPLQLEDNLENRAFCLEFFKIISNHYFDPLKEKELERLLSLSNQVFSIALERRKLSLVIESLGDTEIDKLVKKRLKEYIKGGLYHELFEPKEQLAISAGDIVAVNLEQFDDLQYQEKYYPKEKKLVEEFEYNLNTQRSFKAALIYSMERLLASSGDGPKIFAIDNIDAVFNLQHYSSLISIMTKELAGRSGVWICSVNLHVLEKLYLDKVPLEWLELMGTSLIIPTEIRIANLGEIINLDNTEIKKLETLTTASRMFLIRQDRRSIAVELSIGGLPGLTGFLSSGPGEIELQAQLSKQYGSEKPENWVEPLYDKLANIT